MKGSDIKRGNVIIYNNEIVKITSLRHTKPGKGPAYIQAEGYNITTSSKKNIRLRTSEDVESVMLTQEHATYMYDKGDIMVFMHQSSFEEIEVTQDKLNFDKRLVKDDVTYTVEFLDSNIVSVSAPQTIEMHVTYAEPYLKGQTAAKTSKNIELEGGIMIAGPVHISTNDTVLIYSETLEYIKKI